MKKSIFLICTLFIIESLNAQVSKTINNATGNSSSSTFDEKNTATKNFTTEGNLDAGKVTTKQNGSIVLAELEQAVHGNLQQVENMLNRPSTSKELMKLTGNDKIMQRMYSLNWNIT